MSESRRAGPRYRVLLRADGEPVPLRPFIHDIVGGGMLGMLSGLKDCEAARVLEIRIERRSEDDPRPDGSSS